jgi:hypothetical protein
MLSFIMLNVMAPLNHNREPQLRLILVRKSENIRFNHCRVIQYKRPDLLLLLSVQIISAPL